MRLTADYPPVWLAGFAAAGWLVGRVVPHGPSWQVWPGRMLVAAGLLLMVAAAAALLRRRTTVDPHGQPRALVTGGIFARSRNPIYLGDAVILTGLCLIFDAPLAAPILVPGFVAIISRRFIAVEERRLAAAFGTGFADYRSRTRRWI
ncbi:methyltransferase family protein [Paracoccus salsus]|uniref:methyltransferase family protein n=1 Tax=Paracoccus salsus TaxID=2911061 RepID=UPI001F41EDD9|nr:isoprenylcysteine carboxylmethyltransferase family protein [Paracoccus salsus]MCF3974644.1 isoprenylcysteine carboxylmethyltransferase family protein [Paracoccus salsus]